VAWKIRNGNGTIELGDLSPEQIYALYKAFSPKSLKEWVLSEDDLQVWQSLNEIEWETFLERTMVTSMMSQDKTRFETSESDLALQFESAANPANARQFRRFHKKLILKIIHDNKTYEYLTSDISLGGIHITKSLPPGLSRVFHAFLVRNEESLPINCSIVSTTESGGTNLRIEAVADREMLNRWLIQI
jgi:hypothetical protein